ncbi:MAG: microcin C ABC transporter permease YejB [Desulfobacula sp.]|jgi:microcin C transport system permease protein|uniref:microcin C ABC transporter permease YejB n=1 Tax=Desulfobacula sp. TaxID=2593537 RepID=UPI001D90828D|nr:microcin C ABC transporter permease YejB [Desulfobacula sp.]MBT3486216.1 microcin C ABC transporter permease YejB [Desulfobacula sp.]MBT3803576.1 microcin C ABC transporter permease YejB [Desulfobacula sp.]MBT4025714.1 microcin C ABC transporter permease YejB [Desulfobacula sp.]MBT4199184.1 microcin C ABC transporter permease YejB [Desulfobacula sp.]
MGSYIIRRLLLVIPTLIAIVTINFFIIQIAPGGPVDQFIAKMQGLDSGIMEQVAGSGKTELKQTDLKETNTYRGAQGLDPEVIAEIEKRFGFDKPIHVRYFKMLKDFFFFDFGDSLFRGRSVVELIVERIPVSVSLGLWSTIIIHLVCIPLGIKKALKHSSRFDIWTSSVIIVCNAIPVFLFAILLIILFAGGTYFNWFPLRGLVSVNFDQLSLVGKIIDYFWHMALPTLALVIGGFATLTFLTKNSFLDEIGKQYVVTARAKGLTENKILYGHVFRNAMILVIASFPSAFIGLFFTGSMLIEVIFSLDGMGLLGFQATLQRDFPLMFATLYIFTLMGLILSIISDITYTIVDPRIDFEKR